MVQPHVLLVTFPAQGHINPSLQFAKRLIKMGIEVTFTTSVFAHRRMAKTAASTSPKGLNLAAFSADLMMVSSLTWMIKRYMSEIRSRGSQTLRDIILKSSDEGRPVTSSEVARELHIPSALLWIQPATVLDIYYHYFNGYEDEMKCSSNDPNWSIQLPRLPLLKCQDLPSFLVSSGSKDDKYSFALPTFKEQLDTLDGEEKIQELEPLKAIEKYNLIGIGPLIPSSFLGGKDSLESSFGGDLFKSQMMTTWNGLIEIKRPFLWVIRDQENIKSRKKKKKIKLHDGIREARKIVPWCSQLEDVLSLTVDGIRLWSLSSGIPVVAFPHWTDQGTNAKLIEDVWKAGVRMRVNEDGVVESEEIKRCIEIVMDGGEKEKK
ncbi:hypothetical protein H5410_064902 [Solanum commersonii]|uniref:Uncharacterized protein n=1 Tax=Solanum commersonii TaxID=4109 RepID=A0A9J5VY17_SOLCO|nr:hypothetical protein H5410_064902 [Solanum commersonii]